MRLIDADALLEELNSFSMQMPGKFNALSLLVMNETKKSIAKMIDEQPTIYDIDKVVEQLEEKTERAYKRYMDCGSNTTPFVFARYSAQYQERKMCLDIVKAEMKG